MLIIAKICDNDGSAYSAIAMARGDIMVNWYAFPRGLQRLMFMTVLAAAVTAASRRFGFMDDHGKYKQDEDNQQQRF